MDYEITEKELAPALALTHRAPVTMATIGDGIGGAFGVLMEHAGKTGAQWAGPPFVLYPEVCDGQFEVAVCMPVAPGATGGERVALEEVPGGTVASTVHVGPYGDRQGVHGAAEVDDRRGAAPAGMVRELPRRPADAAAVPTAARDA